MVSTFLYRTEKKVLKKKRRKRINSEGQDKEQTQTLCHDLWIFILEKKLSNIKINWCSHLEHMPRGSLS